MKYKALGCHAFAGGFTFGVMKVMRVDAHLEVFGLGKDTIEAVGLQYIQSDKEITDSLVSENQIWPARHARDVSFLFGNPRCTGFSCLTGGCSKEAHGAWSKQTLDIHQLMRYGVANNIPVICWESVQQAYTVGKPMLNYLIDTLLIPNGYRVAHLFINASTFNNAQNRKRYFFLTYKADKNFNIKAPRDVPKKYRTVTDVILTDEFKKYTPIPGKPMATRALYTHDTYDARVAVDQLIIPYLPWNFDVNGLLRYYDPELEHLPSRYQDVWQTRTSEMPFSLHSLHRLHPLTKMPVISGSAARYVHPMLDRCITVRECARLMGWPKEIVPIGYSPFGQIGKGIVPAVGTWLAEQVVAYLDNEWGDADWESSYDEENGMWVGNRFEDDPIKPVEKVFNLTRYAPPIIKKEQDDGTINECNKALGRNFKIYVECG